MIAPDLNPTRRLGSIEHAGQLIPEEHAIALGSAVLAQHNRKIELQGHWYGNPTGQQYAIGHEEDAPGPGASDEFDSTIYLSESARTTIQQATDAFYDLVPSKLKDRGVIIGNDLLVGTAGSGKWHFDADEDFRAIVNVSPGLLGLMVAVPPTYDGQPQPLEWNSDEGPTLQHQRGLLFFPGEAIKLDNLVGPGLKIPHAGIPKASKVLLRIFARAR